jgi:hypothetical protein
VFRVLFFSKTTKLISLVDGSIKAMKADSSEQGKVKEAENTSTPGSHILHEHENVLLTGSNSASVATKHEVIGIRFLLSMQCQLISI